LRLEQPAASLQKHQSPLPEVVRAAHRDLRPRFRFTKKDLSYRLAEMPDERGEFRSPVPGLQSSESELYSVSFFSQPLS
jgi:hypothetical protein